MYPTVLTYIQPVYVGSVEYTPVYTLKLNICGGIVMRAVYNQFVNTGMSASEASRRVDTLIERIGEDHTVLLFTGYDAVYNHDTGSVDIYNICTGEMVSTFDTYVGDMRHYSSSAERMYSLLFDSYMNVRMLVGLS